MQKQLAKVNSTRNALYHSYSIANKIHDPNWKVVWWISNRNSHIHKKNNRHAYYHYLAHWPGNRNLNQIEWKIILWLERRIWFDAFRQKKSYKNIWIKQLTVMIWIEFHDMQKWFPRVQFSTNMHLENVLNPFEDVTSHSSLFQPQCS